MKKLLLVMGDLATGKTTFANVLSNRYGTSLFFKDSIKEVLGDTIGFSNREDNLKLSKATMELMLLIFSEFRRQDKNLILESNFRPAELEQIHELAEKNEYEVLTLVLHGEVEILHKRYLNRIYNENRHPVHLSTTFDVLDDFRCYVENARKIEIPGKVIHIDANDFSYQTDTEVLDKIDAFFN